MHATPPTRRPSIRRRTVLRAAASLALAGVAGVPVGSAPPTAHCGATPAERARARSIPRRSPPTATRT